MTGPLSPFFCIRNFERFQHYTDRRPPWIKLYRDLWDDPRFFSLSDGERYMLISLFVLASQHENKVSTDQKWLKAKLLTKSVIPLEKLVATGWIEYVEQDASSYQNDSTTQADRYPSRARGETETEVQRQIAPPVGDGAEESAYSPDFEIFWTAYPRKVGKGAAWKAWSILRPSRKLQGVILAAVGTARQSQDWQRDSGKYIPHPTTWLNQARWDDTVTPEKTNSLHGFL